MSKKNGLPHILQITQSHVGSDTIETVKSITVGAALAVESLRVKYTSNAATVQIYDETRGNVSLQSGDLVPAVCGGSGKEPLTLDEPWIIPAGGRIRVRTVDASGTANPIRLALQGRLIPENAYELRTNRIPFWLRFNAVVAANGSAIASALVPIGWALEVYGALVSATSSSLLAQIKTEKLGNWFSEAVHADNFAGNAGELARFSGAGRRFVVTNQDLPRVELTDLSGSSNTVNFYLFGTLAKA